jgi:PII-like signaling protein
MVKDKIMNLLSFYINEKQHHDGMPLYEWLLEEARSLGVHGGSAFRAIAGFGRHGRMHEETFFELAGELAVKVEFVLEEAQAEKLLALVRDHGLTLFSVRQTVQVAGA